MRRPETINILTAITALRGFWIFAAEVRAARQAVSEQKRDYTKSD